MVGDREDSSSTEPSRVDGTNRAKVDPTTKPGTLDFFPKGAAAPKVCPGIYQLEGDVLTVCFPCIEGERPKRFDERKPGRTLDVYLSVKP